MQFDLTEEQTLIKDTAERIARDRLAPVAEKLDRGEGRSELLENLKALADAGFMGLTASSEYGGVDAGAVSFALAMEAIGAACASTAVTVSVNNLAASVLQAVGSEDQKKNYIPKLTSGAAPSAGFCLTEPGAGSDPSGLVTKAEMAGNQWLLNGTKIFITSAEFAGFFIVWARTDPDAPKTKGISCFLVDAGTPGLIIGKAESKMGQIGSATNQVTFEDCAIPASALMGELNDGFRIAVSELQGGRIGVAALAVGIARAAMDAAGAYVVTREQSGQKIADFQGIQWMIADAETDIDAARLLTLRAAYLKDQGRPFTKEASMAKLFATEMAQRATYTALQLHGGAGYMKDLPLERYARDARVTTIYEGTSEIQRLIIAREILKHAGHDIG